MLMKTLKLLAVLMLISCAVLLASGCVQENNAINTSLNMTQTQGQDNQTGSLTGTTLPNNQEQNQTQTAQTTNGLIAAYYSGIKIEGEPAATGVINSLSLVWNETNQPEGVDWKRFAAQFSGKLTIEKEGDYIFVITSDDGSRLYIDNVLSGDLWDSTGVNSRSVAKKMTAGRHDIRIDYKNIGGSVAKLKLEYWSSPLGIERQVIPINLFTIE